MSKINNVDGV